jgi:AraC family transcriptional regulator of arabinose operon
MRWLDGTPGLRDLGSQRGKSMQKNEREVACERKDDHAVCSLDERIRAVLREIENDPSLDTAMLARTAHLSNSRLSHLFKREMGSTLFQFVTDRRLEKAAQLLEETETPVKEVSYSVGYRHPPSFLRAFRKRFGCTPNDYRNRAADVVAQDSHFG